MEADLGQEASSKKGQTLLIPTEEQFALFEQWDWVPQSENGKRKESLLPELDVHDSKVLRKTISSAVLKAEFPSPTPPLAYATLNVIASKVLCVTVAFPESQIWCGFVNGSLSIYSLDSGWRYPYRICGTCEGEQEDGSEEKEAHDHAICSLKYLNGYMWSSGIEGTVKVWDCGVAMQHSKSFGKVCGYMMKLSPTKLLSDRWQRRWFELDIRSKQIKYYLDGDDKVSKGIIYMQRDGGESASNSGNDSPRSSSGSASNATIDVIEEDKSDAERFSLIGARRTYVLKACGSPSRETWVKAVRCVLYGEGPVLRPTSVAVLEKGCSLLFCRTVEASMSLGSHGDQINTALGVTDKQFIEFTLGGRDRGAGARSLDKRHCTLSTQLKYVRDATVAHGMVWCTMSDTVQGFRKVERQDGSTQYVNSISLVGPVNNVEALCAEAEEVLIWGGVQGGKIIQWRPDLSDTTREQVCRPIFTAETPLKSVSCMSFVPPSRMIAAGRPADEIIVFDTYSGEILMSIAVQSTLSQTLLPTVSAQLVLDPTTIRLGSDTSDTPLHTTTSVSSISRRGTVKGRSQADSQASTTQQYPDMCCRMVIGGKCPTVMIADLMMKEARKQTPSRVDQLSPSCPSSPSSSSSSSSHSSTALIPPPVLPQKSRSECALPSATPPSARVPPRSSSGVEGAAASGAIPQPLPLPPPPPPTELEKSINGSVRSGQLPPALNAV